MYSQPTAYNKQSLWNWAPLGGGERERWQGMFGKKSIFSSFPGIGEGRIRLLPKVTCVPQGFLSHGWGYHCRGPFEGKLLSSPFLPSSPLPGLSRHFYSSPPLSLVHRPLLLKASKTKGVSPPGGDMPSLPYPRHGLNCAPLSTTPQHSYVDILTPSTSEGDGICRQGP